MYTTEYYAAMGKNQILLFAITWIHLDGIKLSKISLTKTNTTWYQLNVDFFF